jgi:uncharacterized protein (TIGR03086 family)
MTALEMLGRALEYTCAALTGVTDADLHRPTPCAHWDLAGLLTHMDDGLDAFAEGAAGAVSLALGWDAHARVTRLQVKACALHRLWSRAAHEQVLVGGVPLDTATLVRTATLEIAVHGWDVGAATGRGAPLPDDLAEALLPTAARLVDDADRPARFGPALRPVDVTPGARLLAFLGRAEPHQAAVLPA